MLRVADQEVQLELANKVIEEELSVRETERLAKKIFENKTNETDNEISKKRKIYLLLM